MYIPIERMNKDSRVWIYTSNREFKDQELSLLNEKLKEFTQNWVSHGDAVQASYAIPDKHFIVLSVDESQDKTGGCSIDSAFQFIKNLEDELEVSLLDSKLLSFKDNNKFRQIQFDELNNDIKSSFESDNPYFFNNLVKNLEEWQTKWLIKSSDSWINKYLN